MLWDADASDALVGSSHCETCEAKPPSLVEKILEFQVPVANVVCVPQMSKGNRKLSLQELCSH